jgi:uncharacterized membrane protein YkvA (DUF1232 family)
MTPVGRWYEYVRDSALRWGRSSFGNAGERFMAALFFLPDIVRLLVHLLADSRVFILDKVFVAGVLLYILSPFDFLPEIVAGPFGLIEDLILAIVVLYRLLGNPFNTEAIRDHWRGDQRLMVRIQNGCQALRRKLQRRR